MAQIVTITNPLTGQPAQVDQLEHTAQQIDDAVAASTVESTDYPGCYYRTDSGVTEWVNPPMALGVEYRTTERYLGKPVYVKTVYVGEIAANTNTAAHISDNSNVDVHFRAFCVGKRKFGTGGWEDSVTGLTASPSTIVSCEPTVFRLTNRRARAQITSTVDLKDVYCTGYYTKTTD